MHDELINTTKELRDALITQQAQIQDLLVLCQELLDDLAEMQELTQSNYQQSLESIKDLFIRRKP